MASLAVGLAAQQFHVGGVEGVGTLSQGGVGFPEVDKGSVRVVRFERPARRPTRGF